MPRERPGAGCQEVAFGAPYAIGEPGEVALEDYARALARADAAEAFRSEDDPSRVAGVHICGVDRSLDPKIVVDIEDFARELAVPSGGGGLGWS
jgi:hypothetical protein